MSEQRLIDANRIIDFIDCGHLRNPLELCFSESEVVNMLEQAPTVPAEVVVHCENCQHYQEDNINWCTLDGTDRNPTDYCSYGERRESEAGK